MNRDSNNYVVIFVLVLTSIVAVALAGFREATKTQSAINEDIFNKRAILLAVEDYLGEGIKVNGLSDAQVLDIFNSQIEQVAVDAAGAPVDGIKAESIDMARERKKAQGDRTFPVFIFKQDSEQYYILSVRGKGLWDEIWGNVALKSDLNTIAGVAFDHKGETPGLGAEIKDNPSFPNQFKGKEIFRDGEYVSVYVRKGGARDKTHEVDGISGATVTADGVSDMMYDGIANYMPYLKSEKASN